MEVEASADGSIALAATPTFLFVSFPFVSRCLMARRIENERKKRGELREDFSLD